MSGQNTFPELPSNAGKTVDVKFPDGSTMQWKIVDEIRQNEDEQKIFVLQRLQSRDDRNREMLRFGYYIVGQKPKMKDKWTWGQYAPFVTADDFRAIIDEARSRNWF